VLPNNSYIGFILLSKSESREYRSEEAKGENLRRSRKSWANISAARTIMIT
jgi:hypothetical protein